MPLNTLSEPFQFFSQKSPESMTPAGDKHKIANILASFCKIKIQNAPSGYSGAGGQLIPEKT
jgi:hypothetical protein